MDRFFCPNLAAGTEAVLDEAESQHLSRVLRYTVGDAVELFDGEGRWAAARVVQVAKRSTTLEVTGDLQREPPAALSLILGVAPPKGDRFRWLVEKATELGVKALVPLSCERSVVEPREARLMKLEQTVIAACKQSRRNQLMEIRPTTSLMTFFEASGAGVQMIADPSGAPLQQILATRTAGDGAIACAIGPEGGFTPMELQAARDAGITPISLGRGLLRVETAGVAVAAVVASLESAAR